MKCKNYKKLACCAAMLLLVFAGRAFAYDFSAEFVEKDGAEIQKGKIYISGEMSRYELEGSEAIQVTRADKKVMWIVFPKHRVYVEEAFAGPVSIGSGTGALPKNTGDLSREDLGFEEVDSYRLRKYLVTVKYNKGQTQDKYYEWRRSDFPVPVKTANPSGTVSYEYKKIKMGPQNPSFFVEPKSYKKVTAEELEKLEAQWSAKKKK